MKKNYRGTLLVFRQVRRNINVHQDIRVIAFSVLQILNHLHSVHSWHLKDDRHHHFLRHRAYILGQIVLRGGGGCCRGENGERDSEQNGRAYSTHHFREPTRL